jgi:hypothetical protein
VFAFARRANDAAECCPIGIIFGESVLCRLLVQQGISGKCQDEQTAQALGEDNPEIRMDGREFWPMFRMPPVTIRVKRSKRLRE